MKFGRGEGEAWQSCECTSQFRRRHLRMAILWLSCCLLSLPSFGFPFKERPRIRVAVLADWDLEQLPFFPLFENELMQHKALDIVERVQLAAIMEEQGLFALSSAESCAARLKVGHWAHADLLLILTRVRAERPVVRLVVSETRQGLRLRAVEMTVSTNVEMDAHVLVKELEKAQQKFSEEVSLICAVPPMVSQDLTRKNEGFQASYAHLLEEMLLGMPGALVVDTEEARAIEGETMLGGGDVARRLPVYLLGEFRFETGNAQKPPMARLVLRQGGKELGARQMAHASPKTAPAFFRRAALELLAQVSNRTLAEPDSRKEAQELAMRGRRFYEIGSYREAAALAEASLLLQPGQAQMHRLAMSAYGRCVWGMRTNQIDAIPVAELALEHAEQFLRMTDISVLDNGCWANLSNDLSESLGSVWRPISDAEAKRLYTSYQAHCLEAYRRVMEAKAREGALNTRVTDMLVCRWVMSLEGANVSLEENLALRRQMLAVLLSANTADWERIRDVVADGISDPLATKPAYAAFLSEIETQFNHPAISTAVERQRKHLEMLRQPRSAMASRDKPPEILAASASPPEVDFHPIQWRSEGQALQENGFCFEGMIPCGAEADFVWGHKPAAGARVYVLRKSGEMQPVIIGVGCMDDRVLGRPVYDSRYIWLVLGGIAPRLVAVEVATGATVTLGEEQGLPPCSFSVLTALTPGQIGLAGCFGEQTGRRAFVAVADLNKTNSPRVRIIHEATRQLDLSQDQRLQRLDAQLSFVPKFMIAQTNATGRLQVVIGRSLPGASGWSPALLMDPESGKAQVMSAGVESHIIESDVQYLDGAAYWMTRNGLRRLSVGSTNDTPICTAPEEDGKICFSSDGRVHFVGKSWWIADRLGQPFRKCAAEVPADCSYPSSVGPSICYGIVMHASKDGGWRVYEVSFMGERKASR